MEPIIDPTNPAPYLLSKSSIESAIRITLPAKIVMPKIPSDIQNINLVHISFFPIVVNIIIPENTPVERNPRNKGRSTKRDSRKFEFNRM